MGFVNQVSQESKFQLLPLQTCLAVVLDAFVDFAVDVSLITDSYLGAASLSTLYILLFNSHNYLYEVHVIFHIVWVKN